MDGEPTPAPPQVGPLGDRLFPAMAFLNVPVRDAEVTGVRMDSARELLQLELVLHSCEKVRVDCSNACQWSLSRIERQNVLLDIHEWKASPWLFWKLVDEFRESLNRPCPLPE
ncbi:hypothetical protein EJ065_0730 [Corallococcus coralloides]|uniref:Uncharacterized protein n=1 Tax=Corallococcus coralloides TaxID=184914 RepID=A0A410RKB8_CORCK|nr:hypothetical protein [Corallococcus coralloides]QAT82335.1 hypothetical protein EJ065_0730 [Corallococcus coralloides]